MSQAVLEKLLESKLVAIVRGIPSEQILDLAKAMEAGGITCMEVTFDQTGEAGIRNTLASIAKMKEHLGDRICVGAGTVMTPEQVRQADKAGAEYMIAPDADEAVIRETKRLEKVSIPGAFTPTEAVQAWRWGADIVKMFPAGILGAGYIRAVKAPLAHIPLMAVGGVNPQNCRSFLEAGAVGVGVGGNLVSPKLVAEGRFAEITAVAREYKEALK